MCFQQHVCMKTWQFFSSWIELQRLFISVKAGLEVLQKRSDRKTSLFAFSKMKFQYVHDYYLYYVL